MKKQILRKLDTIALTAFIAILFYIFVEVSQEIALYMVVGAISLNLLWFIPDVKVKRVKDKNAHLIEILEKYSIIREEEIVKLVKENPDLELSNSELHDALQKLSKIWKTSPLMFEVKEKYLYLNEKMVRDLYTQLIIDKNVKIKYYIEKYKFKSRAELEGLIAQFRENKKDFDDISTLWDIDESLNKEKDTEDTKNKKDKDKKDIKDKKKKK